MQASADLAEVAAGLAPTPLPAWGPEAALRVHLLVQPGAGGGSSSSAASSSAGVVGAPCQQRWLLLLQLHGAVADAASRSILLQVLYVLRCTVLLYCIVFVLHGAVADAASFSILLQALVIMVLVMLALLMLVLVKQALVILVLVLVVSMAWYLYWLR